MNKLYSELAPENLYDFNRLLQEAEDFSEEDPKDTPEPEEADPSKIVEDNIFEKVKQNNEEDEKSNADAFLDKQENGSFSNVNKLVGTNDAAMYGLCSVIAGDLLTNNDTIVNYVKVLFDAVGLNDVAPEIFEKIKPAIWDKLTKVSNTDDMNSFSDFKNFVINLVNQNRR